MLPLEVQAWPQRLPGWAQPSRNVFRTLQLAVAEVKYKIRFIKSFP